MLTGGRFYGAVRYAAGAVPFHDDPDAVSSKDWAEITRKVARVTLDGGLPADPRSRADGLP